MIFIWSGLPGNYKTCSAIEFVNERFVKQEKRPVYAYNIAGLRTDLLPGWHNVETLEEIKEWWKFPKGSVLVWDEAQEYIPQRAKDRPPEWIERLAMHRHTDKFAEDSGAYDIVLITQDVMFVDVFVRRLTQSFRHLVRPLGLSYANVSVYPKVINPDDYHDKKTATENFRYKPDKFYFKTYKSADTHTIKRNLPWKKLLVLAALIGVVATCGYYLYGIKERFAGTKPSTDTKGNPVAPKGGLLSGDTGVASGSANNRMDSASLASYVPRVPGLPHTAPRYDEVTKPSVAPMPVACVAKKNECVCFTQQATKMYVHEQQCRAIIADGYFMDFDVAGQAGSKGGVGRDSAPVASVQPVAPQVASASGPYSPGQPININLNGAGGAVAGPGGSAPQTLAEQNLRPLDRVRTPKF